ncbi:hypothetical protein [Nocardioides sp. YIM 152588]|uniref:hypothetical protein n=1 Tax=Nocardioides sp. YIM 152588 TaxID=3158259 RepID=UPI0032E3BD7F
MDQVRILGVDELDSGWEDHLPRFRVYLHGSGDDTTAGWTHAYDVTGADALQVIDWAQRQAADTLTFAVALVVDDKDQGRGLVWLVGMDGNDMVTTAAQEDAQRRMLLRRWLPVGVPVADRIPYDAFDPFGKQSDLR